MKCSEELLTQTPYYYSDISFKENPFKSSLTLLRVELNILNMYYKYLNTLKTEKCTKTLALEIKLN